MTREGPFWDVMEGRVTPPPAAVLLGWELVAVDPAAGTIEVAFAAGDQFLNPAGTIEVAFAAGDQFLNPAGVIQGGFLAAMLDDTLGPALVATLGPGQFAPTPTCTSSSCSRRTRDVSPAAAGSSAGARRRPSWPASCSTAPGRSWPPPSRPPPSAPCAC